MPSSKGYADGGGSSAKVGVDIGAARFNFDHGRDPFESAPLE
jgi:hypothetical protein